MIRQTILSILLSVLLCMIAEKSAAHESDKGELSFQAILFRKQNPNTKLPFCGGAIVTDNHILTLASCVKDQLIENLFVAAGNLTQFYSVKRVKTHELFVNEQNDIAVIEINGNFTTTENATKIELDTEYYDTEIDVVALGIGLSSVSVSSPLSE